MLHSTWDCWRYGWGNPAERCPWLKHTHRHQDKRKREPKEGNKSIGDNLATMCHRVEWITCGQPVALATRFQNTSKMEISQNQVRCYDHAWPDKLWTKIGQILSPHVCKQLLWPAMFLVWLLLQELFYWAVLLVLLAQLPWSSGRDLQVDNTISQSYTIEASFNWMQYISCMDDSRSDCRNCIKKIFFHHNLTHNTPSILTAAQ